MDNSTSSAKNKSLISLVDNTKPFLSCSIILLCLLGIALCFVPKEQLHLLLCNHHTPFLDAILPTYSDLVNWLPYATIVLLLFYRAGWSAFLAADILITTAVVQPLKHIIAAPRPITWFAENFPDVQLPLTPDVKMNFLLSFPSGHTTTFFLLFFTLSLIIMDANVPGKRIYSFLCFLLAALGAYSRIYLSQHFALDIFAGICIALICTLILYLVAVPRLQDTRFWSWTPQKRKK